MSFNAKRPTKAEREERAKKQAEQITAGLKALAAGLQNAADRIAYDTRIRNLFYALDKCDIPLAIRRVEELEEDQVEKVRRICAATLQLLDERVGKAREGHLVSSAVREKDGMLVVDENEVVYDVD